MFLSFSVGVTRIFYPHLFQCFVHVFGRMGDSSVKYPFDSLPYKEVRLDSYIIKFCCIVIRCTCNYYCAFVVNIKKKKTDSYTAVFLHNYGNFCTDTNFSRVWHLKTDPYSLLASLNLWLPSFPTTPAPSQQMAFSPQDMIGQLPAQTKMNTCSTSLASL